MRTSLLALSLLLLPACATTAPPAHQSPTSASPHSSPASTPAVHAFRCALDNRPRMLVIHFGNGLHAAWDTGGCFLYKVWIGDVLLTGTVYDTKHGPRPSARGTILLASSQADSPVPTTQPAPSPQLLALLEPPAAPSTWLGHEVTGSSIRLAYQQNNQTVTVTLSPTPNGFPLHASTSSAR